MARRDRTDQARLVAVVPRPPSARESARVRRLTCPPARPWVSTTYEQGTVAPHPVVHAAVRSVAGYKALCGAGRISMLVPGRFSLAQDNACPQCVQRAT